MKTDIEKEICALLHDKFKVSQQILEKENFTEPLTGNIFGFGGFLLAVLFCEIEKLYGIRISEKELLNYEFCSIHGIVELVARYKENTNS